MTSKLAATVVLTLAALASLSLPAPGAFAQDETTHALVVKVTGAGGLALSGATVTVTLDGGDAAFEETTDVAGNASFDLPPGNYTVEASAPGHAAAKEAVALDEDTSLAIALETASVLTGDLVVVVTDADGGDAIEDALVTVRFTDRSVEIKERTDEDGEARFEDLAYGSGEVLVTHRDFERNSEKFTLDSAEETVEVELRPEDATGDAEVRVRVLDQDGDPIEGALVTGNTWEGTGSQDSDETGDDGWATLSLSAARGGVSATHEDYYGGWAEFDATDGDAEVEVRMQEKPQPDARLTGIVVDEENRPVEGAELHIRPDYQYWYLRQEKMAAPFYCCPETIVATTDDDGRFDVEVYSGSLWIDVYAKGYAGQNERVAVESGDTTDVTIHVVKVPPKDATVSGRVVDATTGLPVENAGVSLQNLEWSDYGWATTGKDGRFEITTYPGYVQLSVWANQGPVCIAADTATTDAAEGGASSPPSEGNTTSADAYGAAAEERAAEGAVASDVAIWPGPCTFEQPVVQYYTFVVQFDVESGDNPRDARLERKPEPSVELVGYVVDPETDGAIPGAWVNVRNEDTGEWGNAQTDEDGSYRLMVRPGHLVLDASAEGHFAKSETLVVTEEGRFRHDVELRAGVTRWVPCDGCYPYAVAESDGKYYAGADGMQSGGGRAPAMPVSDAAGAPSMEESGARSLAGDDAASTSAGRQVYSGGGGGLGPYKATDAATPGGNEAPGAGLALAVLALAAVALLARRR